MPFFSQYSLLLQKKTVRPTSLHTRKGHYMTSTQWILDSIDVLNEYLWTYVVIVMLVGCAIYFTVRSKGVQFRLLKDMVKIIIDRPIYNNKVEGKAQASGNDERLKKIGSFQAFACLLYTSPSPRDS